MLRAAVVVVASIVVCWWCVRFSRVEPFSGSSPSRNEEAFLFRDETLHALCQAHVVRRPTHLSPRERRVATKILKHHLDKNTGGDRWLMGTIPLDAGFRSGNVIHVKKAEMYDRERGERETFRFTLYRPSAYEKFRVVQYSNA